MKLTDQEQVILKAIEHVAGSRNGLASVPAVTRAVSYPISTTQKILAALHRKEIIALHHHDYPAQMSADEKKRAVKIGSNYFHAVAIRNPMKRGAAKTKRMAANPKGGRFGSYGSDGQYAITVNKTKSGYMYRVQDRTKRLVVVAQGIELTRAAAWKAAKNFTEGAAKSNPSPAQLKARAAFTRMAKKRAAEAKKANPPGMGEKAGRAADAKVRKSINGYLAQGWDFQKIKDRVWLYYGYTLIALDAEKATFTSLFQKGGWILYLNPKRGGVSSVKTNPVKRKRAANPRYLVSATDARGNIADLGVLVSPNKTQAVARAKKLYKGYKKFTAAIVDKGDYIGPKGVVKIRRKRPTKKTNPRKASGGAIFSGSFGSVPVNKKFRILPNEKAVSPADRGKVFTATNQRGQAKDADGYMHYFPIWASVELVNPTRNGIAKTAGKAIKKVTRAVLGGVSKVAGKGAKALKNPKQYARFNVDSPFGKIFVFVPIYEGVLRKAKTDAITAIIAEWGPPTHSPVRLIGASEPKIVDNVPSGAHRIEGAHDAWFIKTSSFRNPSRRRNLDHRDSSHQVKVHQHWRAGGLSQWQRAHHAGQHDLFSHGIKAKPKRNPDRRHLQAEAIEYALKGRTLTDMKSDFEYANFSPKEYAIARKYFLQFRGKSPEQIQALMSGAASKARAGFDAKKKRRRKTVKKNPSATAIRKKFAGRVSGQKTLYFPKGAPQGMAKLGRLVSIKLKGGKLIKPSRRNPSAEIWLCSDTSGKLWLGCTKAGPLYAGAPGDLGEMSMLEYSESKPHIGYPAQTIWFHKMGEVSGRRPHLIVNDDQDLLIKGGNYKITRAGIVD